MKKSSRMIPSEPSNSFQWQPFNKKVEEAKGMNRTSKLVIGLFIGGFIGSCITYILCSKLSLSPSFWTAVGSAAAILGLYLIYTQIRISKEIAGADFLLKLDNRFSTDEMKKNRHNLAKTLMDDPDNIEKIDKLVDEVIFHFEDIGLLLRKGHVLGELVWVMQSYYILRYWKILNEYIEWLRETQKDRTFYTEFENLHMKMVEIEKKKRKKQEIQLSNQKLKEFLVEEISLVKSDYKISK